MIQSMYRTTSTAALALVLALVQFMISGPAPSRKSPCGEPGDTCKSGRDPALNRPTDPPAQQTTLDVSLTPGPNLRVTVHKLAYPDTRSRVRASISPDNTSTPVFPAFNKRRTRSACCGPDSAMSVTATEIVTKKVNETLERDFFWSYTEEPHRTRRQAIMSKYPEVSKLCGPEPLTKYAVLLVLVIQFTAAISLRDTPILSWPFMLTAYAVGGTCNQNIFLAIHEISHNLAFKSTIANRYFAILANLPIGLPYSAAFRPYHLEHHKHLGVDGIDTDLPTRFEALFLHNVLGKAFFATFQIFFYAIRPMMVKSSPFTMLHFANLFTQLVFDYCLVSLFGWRPLMYLLFSSFFAGSLHPCAGHFIAEHYVFEKSLQVTEGGDPAETYSYYGPLNMLTYNVGYHNEHHDFPYVPWTRLPKLRSIASDFYEDLPSHTSWSYVIYQFIVDPRVGMFSRVKRQQKQA